MAPYAYSVTKNCTWRGQVEQFSNVYHYDHGIGEADLAHWEATLDELVAAEKAVHGSGVNFVTGRVWGPTDAGPAASQTRLIKDYSGTGSGVMTATMWYELCGVVQWFLGRSTITGRKVYLRKYIHALALVSTSAATSSGIALTTAQKAPFVTYGDRVKNVASAGASSLPICTKDGDHLPAGTSTQVLDNLHIRQFKQ